MNGKTALAYLAFFGIIAAGLFITNMQGWERDERRSLEQVQADTHRAEYEKRAARGPYVVRRSELSSDEQIVHIAIPDPESGRPRLDTNCLVYRDREAGSSSMVCPGASGYDLVDDSARSHQ